MKDLIDRLREYASTRKGELAELIIEAADALEIQTCDDAVSRQAAIDALSTPHGILYPIRTIEALPAVQPQRNPDEWCHDCKEYDSEKHCCPRWNSVIRETLSEQPEIIRCKDCMHNGSFDTDCPINWNGKEYCSFAERRTDD